jgi:hypothetical protein
MEAADTADPFEQVDVLDPGSFLGGPFNPSMDVSYSRLNVYYLLSFQKQFEVFGLLERRMNWPEGHHALR